MTVEVYSSPGTSAYQSTRYSATVNGTTAYVYGFSRVAVMPTQLWNAGATVEPAWFQFGADETATVVVTKLSGPITSAVVYPADKGVTYTIAGGVLTLRMPVNVRIWIECNTDRIPLLIQSRPLKPALPSPRTDWSTLGKLVSSIDTGTNVLTFGAAHGYTVGQRVVWSTTGTLPSVTGTALQVVEPVYVLTAPTATTMTVSRTPGGAAIDFTGTGTGSLRLYPGEWTNASSAIYFPAGVHVVGRLFKLGTGVTCYIDGGAVLVATSFDVRASQNVNIVGAGQVFCNYALWADVYTLPYEQLVEYSPFLGLNFATFGYSNEVNGIMLAAWPHFFAREGVAHWENVLGVSPWNYNNDGFDCSVTLDGSESTVDHCMMFCADDTLYLESNWFTLHATDLFGVNANGGTFLFGYWGEQNLGKFQKLTDCDAISIVLDDEALGLPASSFGGNAIIKLWNDNREAEAELGYGRFNIQIRGLKVWGPRFDNCLLSIDNRLYPFGDLLIRDGLGDMADILLQDIWVQATPGQISKITGRNWANTPHDIQFVGCEFEGVKLTAANFFDYFETNAYPYNITVEGHPVVTAVDISNTALDLIGHAKRITDLSPPDGSAEAAVCAEHYTDCVNELLDSHDWNLATVKRALVARPTSDDPAWEYCYELPAGLLRVISIIPADATDNHYTATAAVPVDYEIHADTSDVVRIYTDLEDAWVRFVKYVTNPNLFSPTFLEALQWKLASRIAGPIIKGTEGAAERDRCTGQYMMAMAKATTRDARQQRREAQKTIASWHKGR
jgi:hypothetical protein